MLLTIIICISALGFNGAVAKAGAGGVPDILEYSSNTSSSAFVISSYSGMVAFSSLASTTNFKGVTVSLACDIDMSVGEYTPFASFAGTFDGKGHALKNIKINASEVCAGIFAKTTSAAIVKNLGVVGGTMTLAASLDSHRLGSIVGQMSGGTVERCYSTASLVIKKFNSSSTDDLSIGGIVGANLNGGIVKNCMFAGTAEGVKHASGISDWGQGHNEGAVGTIINCLNIGKLSATTCYGLARYSGSILESNKANAVSNSYYLGGYTDLDFTTQDIKTTEAKIGSGELAYLLNQSGANKVWSQGELCPELEGTASTGVYKLTLNYVCNGVTTSQTVYMNAGDKYSVPNGISGTITSAGNVTDNVFTMPAANASLTLTTTTPNIVNYASGATEFVITNAAGFTKLATLVNGGTTMSGVSLYMLNDIDMSSVSNHTPIGVYISDSDYSTAFQGKLYGGGFKVVNLKVSQSALNGAGLFGVSYKASFDGVGICGGSVSSANRAGGLSGYADGCTIKNCYNTASITTQTGTDGAGGLTGVSRSSSKFTNCFNIGAVTAKADCAGGLSGWGQTNAVFKNCFNMGAVSASDTQSISRHGASLTTPPYASYYIDTTTSTYGTEKTLTQFVDGSVAWLLNTSEGGAENSGAFTTTPRGPALCTENSAPAVKTTVIGVDGDGRTLDVRAAYTNAGATVGIGNANSIYNQSLVTAAKTDSKQTVTVVPVGFSTLAIGNATGLAAFATAVNGGNSYKNYYVYLTADIDMTGMASSAIGTASAPFMGVFDGCGKVIKGVSISSTDKFQGLFGFLKGGVVENLRLESASVTGGNYSGTIVGNNEGGAVYSCGTNAAATGYYSTSRNEISVMSFNIRVPSDASPNSLSDRTPRVKQHLNTYNPDIIGFQEVTSPWKSVLDSHLSGYSKEFVWRDSNASSEAAPLYWKTSKFTVLEQDSFWLSSTPDKMSIDWSAGCYRTCSYAALLHKTTGTLVLAFNTHFDHQSATARENSALLLTKRMRALQDKYTKLGYGENIAIFCTGDYNCKPTTTAYANMTKEFSDMRNVTDSLGCAENQNTFHGWGASSSIIDYIFTDTRGSNTVSFKVCAEQINGGYISDHYTLYSVIGLEAQCLGGVVGINSGIVSDCYTLGTVKKSLNAGGIVGYNLGTVQNSYSGKTVSATDHMGGVAGVERGTSGNCYYLSGAYTANADYVNTIGGKTEAEIKSASLAALLNRGGKIWAYNDGFNGAYPYQLGLFELLELVVKNASAYIRNGESISNVALSTEISELSANFENTNLKFYNANGAALGEKDYAGTGTRVAVVAGGKETDAVIVVVRGDLNGDAVISSADYVLILKHIKTEAELTGAFKLASDMDSDGLSTSADYISIKDALKG